MHTKENENAPASRPQVMRTARARLELDIGKTTFWKLVKEKQLETIKVGGVVYVVSESVDQLIRQARAKARVQK